MMKQIVTAFMACLMLTSASLSASTANWQDQSIAELENSAVSMHPAGFYFLATKLFAEGEKDRALFWFYVGQIRYRFHLSANPALEPSGDPALFSSLQQIVGAPINEFAGGNPERWAKTVSEAVDWDKKNINEFTSKTEHLNEYQNVQEGVNGLLEYIQENAANLRSEREQNGLKNR